MRIRSIYEDLGYKVALAGWNRDETVNLAIGKADFVYARNAKFGRGIHSSFAFLGWFNFVVTTLLRNRTEYSLIHACDFDSFFPSFPLKLFLKKKIVYDIFDIFAYSRNIPRVFHGPLLLIESILARFADLVVLPDHVRISQLILKPKNLFVIENVPSIRSFSFLEKKLITEQIHVGYVGTLTRERGLENLMSAASTNPHINFSVAGKGELENELKSFSEKHSNFSFFGAVTAEQALALISSCHINYAMYHIGGKFHKNHLLACPNKFYESLYTGTPILTNKGTLFAEKVIKNGAGFTIEQDARSLTYFLNNIELIANRDKVSIILRDIWKQNYAEYYENIKSHFKEKLSDIL